MPPCGGCRTQPLRWRSKTRLFRGPSGRWPEAFAAHLKFRKRKEGSASSGEVIRSGAGEAWERDDPETPPASVVSLEDNLLAMPSEARQALAHAGNHEVQPADVGVDVEVQRSEERRVGKECRSRWSPY